MKKIFTLAAAGSLAIATLSAQAQTIAVDGVLGATEISSTGYQLVGRYTNNHSFGDAGLLSLYAAADANNVYFFLAGTLETAADNTVRNSLQLYFARPGVAGIPVGTALPLAGTSTPLTSFQNVGSKMDFPVNFGLGVKGTTVAGQVQVEGIVYTAGTTPTAATQVLASGLNVTTGASATVSATGTYAPFANAVVAFKNSSKLSTNPGSPTGAAASTGLEVSMSRASLGIPATGGAFQLFGLQNNADGNFFSSDIIPQNTGAAPGADANGSLQHNPDFTAIPGLQVATLQLSATGGVLASKAAAAAQVFSLYPNPVSTGNLVQLQLNQSVDRTTYTLRNVLGQVVQTRTFVGKAAQVATAGLPAGTYLLTVENPAQPATTSRVQVY